MMMVKKKKPDNSSNKRIPFLAVTKQRLTDIHVNHQIEERERERLDVLSG